MHDTTTEKAIHSPPAGRFFKPLLPMLAVGLLVSLPPVIAFAQGTPAEPAPAVSDATSLPATGQDETGEMCGDSVDNDGDGFTDCGETSCHSTDQCRESAYSPLGSPWMPAGTYGGGTVKVDGDRISFDGGNACMLQGQLVGRPNEAAYDVTNLSSDGGACARTSSMRVLVLGGPAVSAAGNASAIAVHHMVSGNAPGSPERLGGFSGQYDFSYE